MKEAISLVLVIALVAGVIMGVTAFLRSEKPYEVSKLQSDYSFGSDVRFVEDYSDDYDRDNLPENQYSEAIPLEKKSRITIEADVIKHESDAEKPQPDILVSTTDGIFDENSSNIDFHIFEYYIIVSDGRKSEYELAAPRKGTPEHELENGETCHVEIVLERYTNNIRVWRSFDGKDSFETKYKSQTKLPDKMYFRLGAVDTDYKNVKISATHIKTSRSVGNTIWAIAFVLVMILLYFAIVSLSMGLHDVNGKSMFKGFLMIPLSLLGAAIVTMVSQFFTDKLYLKVNDYIYSNMSLRFLKKFDLTVQLPKIGTQAFWITLGVCVALFVILTFIVFRFKRGLSIPKAVCGFIVLLIFHLICSVMALTFFTSLIETLAPLAILFGILILFGGAASGSYGSYSGPHAEELEKYDKELSQKERNLNMYLTGQPRDAREMEIHGAAYDDRDLVEGAQLQQMLHREKMREYEKKLNEKDREDWLNGR